MFDPLQGLSNGYSDESFTRDKINHRPFRSGS